MALSSGKPAIGVETMGKVKGLFDLFSLGDYCVERYEDFGTTVVTRIELLQTEYSKVCASIEATLPEIRRKSALNFTGLL